MSAVTPTETVRRLFELVGRGDRAALTALLHAGANVPEYFGGDRDGARRTELDAHRLDADGDVVTVRGRIRVFSAGCLTDSPACWRFVVRDGLVARIDSLRAGALPLAA